MGTSFVDRVTPTPAPVTFEKDESGGPPRCDRRLGTRRTGRGATWSQRHAAHRPSRARGPTLTSEDPPRVPPERGSRLNLPDSTVYPILHSEGSFSPPKNPVSLRSQPLGPRRRAATDASGRVSLTNPRPAPPPPLFRVGEASGTPTLRLLSTGHPQSRTRRRTDWLVSTLLRGRDSHPAQAWRWVGTPET